MDAGRLDRRVAFDAPAGVPDGYGGTTEAWAEQHVCAAAFLTARGDEAVQAARLAGRSVEKVAVRACRALADMNTDWRLRDRRSGAVYDIRHIDDTALRRGWLYLTVETSE